MHLDLIPAETPATTGPPHAFDVEHVTPQVARLLNYERYRLIIEAARVGVSQEEHIGMAADISASIMAQEAARGEMLHPSQQAKQLKQLQQQQAGGGGHHRHDNDFDDDDDNAGDRANGDDDDDDDEEDSNAAKRHRGHRRRGSGGGLSGPNDSGSDSDENDADGRGSGSAGGGFTGIGTRRLHGKDASASSLPFGTDGSIAASTSGGASTSSHLHQHQVAVTSAEQLITKIGVPEHDDEAIDVFSLPRVWLNSDINTPGTTIVNMMPPWTAAHNIFDTGNGSSSSGDRDSSGGPASSSVRPLCSMELSAMCDWHGITAKPWAVIEEEEARRTSTVTGQEQWARRVAACRKEEFGGASMDAAAPVAPSATAAASAASSASPSTSGAVGGGRFGTPRFLYLRYSAYERACQNVTAERREAALSAHTRISKKKRYTVQGLISATTRAMTKYDSRHRHRRGGDDSDSDEEWVGARSSPSGSASSPALPFSYGAAKNADGGSKAHTSHIDSLRLFFSQIVPRKRKHNKMQQQGTGSAASQRGRNDGVDGDSDSDQASDDAGDDDDFDGDGGAAGGERGLDDVAAAGITQDAELMSLMRSGGLSRRRGAGDDSDDSDDDDGNDFGRDRDLAPSNRRSSMDDGGGDGIVIASEPPAAAAAAPAQPQSETTISHQPRAAVAVLGAEHRSGHHAQPARQHADDPHRSGRRRSRSRERDDDRDDSRHRSYHDSHYHRSDQHNHDYCGHRNHGRSRSRSRSRDSERQQRRRHGYDEGEDERYGGGQDRHQRDGKQQGRASYVGAIGSNHPRPTAADTLSAPPSRPSSLGMAPAPSTAASSSAFKGASAPVKPAASAATVPGRPLSTLSTTPSASGPRPSAGVPASAPAAAPMSAADRLKAKMRAQLAKTQAADQAREAAKGR